MSRTAKMSPELQEKYKINRDVTIEEVGVFLNEAMDLAHCGDAEISRDCLVNAIAEMHTKLFPNAWRTPTPEDNRKMILELLNGALEELTKDNADCDHTVMLISEAYGKVENLSLK